MALKLTNNATSTLATTITDSATSLSVQSADAGLFPVLGAGDWFPITVVDASNNMEVMKVTARATAVLTVERAQEGTTALAFAAGARIDLRVTAAALQALENANAITGATAKTAPVDADEFGYRNSSGGGFVKSTWAQIKAAFWAALGALIIGGTSKATPVDADSLALADSADANNTKKLSWANVKATLLSYFITKFARVDAVQAFTASEQGQGRANIGAGVMAGFRNKIINGDFGLWQRGTSVNGISAGAYGADRWICWDNLSSNVNSQQAFALGQTDVPGNPKYWQRSVVVTSAGAAAYAMTSQRIEGVETLAGKLVTITFWAKADAVKNIAIDLTQNFGSGGAPSAEVNTPCGLKALTTAWQKFSFTATVPSVSGKTKGSGGNDSLELLFWFDAGSNFNTRASNLGQQSGTFDIAHVSIVEGDATAEADPFSPRHIQQELALCKRYFERINLPSSHNLVTGHAVSTTQVYWDLKYADKRVAPTITIPTTVYPITASGGLSTVSTHSPAARTHSSRVLTTVNAVMVAGNAAALFANGDSVIDVDAEL